jgi:hypothetical protein
MLGEDVEDFFFGVPLNIETEEENKKLKEPPIKTIKHNLQVEKEVKDDSTGQVKKVKATLKYRIRVYKR